MDDKTETRHGLLCLRGRVYRLFPVRHIAPCYRRVYFATRDGYQKFLQPLHSDPYSRHVLRAEVIRWTGYDIDAAQALHQQRVGLYEVAPSGIPRGEKKKLPEKPSAVLETAATVADNLPIVGPTKSALQVITGTDLITDEPVSRLGAVAGIALGLVPGGKLIAKGVIKVSEKLGEKGLVQHEKRTGKATAAGFVKRHKGPDGMTRDNGKLTEGEAKGAKDGNTRVAKDTQNRKQGSARKNKAYAEKMLRQKKKVGKPSNRIGGPYTVQEMELWQEVKDNIGRKNHISAHTNTETGQVRVFERDHDGDIVKQTDAFQLDDFAATKKKLIEDFGE